MAIRVRNLNDPYEFFGGNAFATSSNLLLIKSLLWMGGWSEVSDNGDPAWASTITHSLTGGTGLQVAAASPLQVTSPTGVFTQAMADDGDILVLKASNEQNCGAWRIVTYVDAYTVRIDAAGAPIPNWADESNIDARILAIRDAKLGVSDAILSAPGSNLHVRLYRQDNSYGYIYARPLAGLGDNTETTGIVCGAYYQGGCRFNATIDGKNALIFYLWEVSNNSSNARGMAFMGELDDTPPEDANPGFVMGSESHQGSYAWNIPIQMLDANPAPAPIQAYMTWMNQRWGVADDSSLDTVFSRRLLNGSPGYARFRAPHVCLADRVNYGGGLRGRLPLIRQTYVGFESYIPIDQAGAYQHLTYGLVVPRHGHDDQLLVRPL